MQKWIFDLETYPNTFSFSIIREDGKFPSIFEVSFRKNDIERIWKCLDYLRDNDCFMVGFNNLQFDYPVLHKLLAIRDNLPAKGETLAKKVFKFAQEEIESMKGDGFGNVIKESERYVKQIDLFKIHHFDNKAKMTSLKMLEFNMREQNIADLPYAVGTNLKSNEIDVLLKYNMHDVMMTLAFYNHSLSSVQFREQLTAKYDRDFMNHNDTKIGKDYFIMELEKLKIPVYKYVDGKRKINQTKRPTMKIRDCLFEYYDFVRPEFIVGRRGGR